MRLALDARTLNGAVPRGWDRYTVGLARELVRRGVDVVLLERKSRPLNPALLGDLPCPVASLDDHGAVWWEQLAAPLALRRLGADVYHLPAGRGVPLMAPCPVVVTVHGAFAHGYAELIGRGQLPGSLAEYVGTDVHPYTPTPAHLYWHAQVRRAAWVLAPSEFAREEVVRFLEVPARRVSATPLAADVMFHAPPRAPQVRRATLERLGVRPPYLLYVGGYEPHKNVEGLLSVFARVRSRRSDLTLLCVGSTAVPPRLIASAAASGLQPGREVVLSSADLGPGLVDLYDDAELLVTMSWRETFCLPALEALTRGVGVVASAWGAAPEVVGGSGALVDPRDHGGAARAVLRLLADPGRSERARTRAARFTWQRTAELSLDVYHRVLEERHG